MVHTLFGWGFFVPSAYLIGTTLGYGLYGAWIGGLAQDRLSSVAAVERLARDPDLGRVGAELLPRRVSTRWKRR